MGLLLSVGVVGVLNGGDTTPAPLAVTALDDSYTTSSASCIGRLLYLECVATGGVPPYSYSWVKLSGAGELSQETQRECRVAITNVCPGDTYSGTYQVTVTDSESTVVTGTSVATAQNTFTP